ncbi:hypothetical protein HZA97_07700 [Candidatus Woesearchaeota archaeon]|nr:hypothetical protein [Candidatus Woesearchaeota archaeon]
MEQTLSTYLRKGKDILEKYGVKSTRDSRLITLLSKAQDVDEGRVLAICQTIQYMDDFNELARSKTGEMHFADRYNDITKTFESIRTDSAKLLQQAENGIGFFEKWANKIKFFFKGTPNDRFLDGMETVYKVCDDLETQLKRETEIKEAYKDFRTAFKQAEVLTFEVLEQQAKILTAAEVAFKTASDAVTNYKGENRSEKSNLELARDEAERAYEAQKEKRDMLEFIANDMVQSYNTTEGIVASVNETHKTKNAVYMRSVSFIGNNETMFTMMSVAYTQILGLNEGTRTLKSIKEAATKGIQQMGDLSTKVNKEGVTQAYGIGVEAEVIRDFNRKLTDQIVESRKLEEEQRTANRENTVKIEQYCQEEFERRRKGAYKFLSDEDKAALEVKVEEPKLLAEGSRDNINELVTDVEYKVKVEKQ